MEKNPVLAFSLKLDVEVFFEYSQHAFHITCLEEPGDMHFFQVFIHEYKLDTGVSLDFLDDFGERFPPKNETPFPPGEFSFDFSLGYWPGNLSLLAHYQFLTRGDYGC